MNLRAGIIGYGLSGRVFHHPLLQASGFEVVSIGVRTAEGRVPVDGVSFTDPAAVFTDPSLNLVVVTSPNELHVEHSMAAITAGKHVVIEKPVATTLRGAETVAAAAAGTDRVVSVFHSRRWDGDYLTLSGILESKAVGDWKLLESRWSMNKPVAQQRWKDLDDQGGGLLTDFMPHLVDQALHLFGLPDRATLDQAVQREGGNGTDYLCVTLLYGNKRVVLSADCFGFGPSQRFRLAGPSGEYVCGGVDPQEAQLRAGLDARSASFGTSSADRPSTLTTPSGERKSVPVGTGRYVGFYDQMRLAIETGAPPPVAVEDAVKVVGLIDALRRDGVWTSTQAA